MRRPIALFGIVFLSTIVSGCVVSGGSFYIYGKDGSPISEIHAKFKPIASFHSGSAADITNDSRYDVEVITMYVSEYGYWHSEKYFMVPAGYKGFAAIPAPGYTNWSTCGSGSVTIRIQIDGQMYSSVERISICNTSPSLPAYIITNDTIRRRINGQGELWDKPGWGY